MEAIFVYSLVLIFFLLFLLFIMSVLLHATAPVTISAQESGHAPTTRSDKAAYALLALIFIGLYGYALFTLRKRKGQN